MIAVRPLRLALPALLLAIAVSGCAGTHAGRSPVRPIPAGRVGSLVNYGREILDDTPKYAKGYVTADMSCQACHLDSGTKSRGGTLVGLYAQFPQWNGRAHRVIALQDRIAECFLYSMNGRPPAYQSKEMEALVAYIAWLSRGTPVGTKPNPAVRIARFAPPGAPSARRGTQIYAQKCEMCHGANGAGVSGRYPPLWGPKSFNNGAGMHKLGMMAGFVKYNMPANAPGTLTKQQSYDVSAYVLSHSRPKFDKNELVTFPAQRAGYF